MSESEVSHIRDEDVLRRMWQQTEDFSRKKEIRAHMYRLREERLRNLYSPEPTPDGKGCEFTSTQGHVKSFADQTFQSMKSKEVRDAGSPPKEFVYRGQDLKELSNAGWNVESENSTTDEGRTRVRAVNATIEGRYDVEGGRGQFAAEDHQRQATSEYQDDHSSLRRDESSTASAAREHVVQRTADGTHVSSTTSSSNTSKFQQVSSTKHETVPITTDDDYDLARRNAPDTNRNEPITRITNRNDYEQTLRKNDFSEAELVSRKVEYPDDNTRVIVETRCLPDGTRVTSTRREFRVPAQSTRSEYQTRSESKSYSSHHKSDIRDSTSKTTRQTIDNRSGDIVDSQRNVDDYDFKRQLREYTNNDNDDYSDTHQRHVTKINKKVSDYSQTENDYSQQRYETKVHKKAVDHSTTDRDDHTYTQHRTVDRQNDNLVDETDRRHTTRRDHDVHHNVYKETHHASAIEENNTTRIHKENKENIRHITSDKTIYESGVHDIPRNEAVPSDKAHDIPRDKAAPVGRTPDVSRDGTVPFDKVREIPHGIAPRDKTRDVPYDGTVPTNEGPHIPRERTIPESNIHNVPVHRTTIDEKTHQVTKDKKVEEVIEKKITSDHYQTTYQNDFQSRKISTEWSPTHQAWASTLRSDTPSTTRPSTRASSPGSRTFKSSTSSLRSSVSPDKSSRKPSSRGGSPNKVDRYSPTRTVTSDRYSSTRSTHSVTDVKTNKNISPERKPPTGRSPTRPGYSPERTSKDGNRQRPSASPEKRPKNFQDRLSVSPDRKPPQQSTPTNEYPRRMSPSGRRETSKSPNRPTQSPERKPTSQITNKNPSANYPQNSPYRSTSSPDRKITNDYQNRSSPRSSPSPDRKPGYQQPSNTPATDNHSTFSPSQTPRPTSDAPKKSGTSPDRKPGYQQPLTGQSPDKAVDKDQDSPTKRLSTSPDRKPNYMRPTAASHQPGDRTTKPKSDDTPATKSPSKQQSPNRKPQDFIGTTTNKITEDHYKFVDEETKTYTRTDNTNVHKKASIIDENHPRDKSPSPISKVPGEDAPDYCKAPFNKDKSPSPLKDTVIVTENDELYGRIDKTIETNNVNIKHNKQIDDITTVKQTSIKKEHTTSPTSKDTSSREPSPSKFGTYDKKKPREQISSTEVTTASEDTKEFKYDSLTRRDKSSPKKIPDTPSSHTKKSSRDGTSPVKSPTKDTKYKHTTDFITTEKTTEEINKKSNVKDRPRQLVTPSSSPTRKPKVAEPEPSTGQSSPTTSVSEFMYFGSPRTEQPLVTDLDDFVPDSENITGITKRPESLDVKRSPSPSKIPCRSPSPEKYVPSTKDNLPRKSSLKKPSTDISQASPVEKPPTSFRISPTDDKPIVPTHKVVKKDHPSKSETGEPEHSEPDSTSRPKPPLQRRETYEDRCKKMLGMVDDTLITNESITKETKVHKNKPVSSPSSPSVSPCDSPTIKEVSPLPEQQTVKKTTQTIVDVTDFIAREQDELTKTNVISTEKKTKIPSRESSPTKFVTDKKATQNKQENTFFENVKIVKDTPQKRPSESPERKPTLTPSKASRPTDSSPSRSDLSPEQKPAIRRPNEMSPSRISPDKAPGHSKVITSVTSTFDSTSTTDEVEQTENITKKIIQKSQPTRVLESPTREIPKSAKGRTQPLEHSRTPSPSKPLFKDESPTRSISQDQKYQPVNPDDSKPDVKRPDDISRSRPRESPERRPDYTKPTSTITSKYDSSYITTEDVNETYSSTGDKKITKTKTAFSPTRQIQTDTDYASSLTKPAEKPDRSTKKPEPSPERKPTKDSATTKASDDAPVDSLSAKPREIPGYMKTTAAVTTKFESTLTSETIQDTTKSKIVEKKHVTSRSPDSPSRKTQPKSTPENRTPSPTKPQRPSEMSLDKKPSRTQQLLSPTKETHLTKLGSKHPSELSPTRKSPEKIPGYMKATASVTSKYESTDYTITTKDDIQESVTSITTDGSYPGSRSESPRRQTPIDESAPKDVRGTSPSRPKKQSLSPERKPSDQHKLKDSPKEKSPTRTQEFIKTTTSKFDTSTTDNIEENVTLRKVSLQHPTQTTASKIDNRPITLPSLKTRDESPNKSARSPDQKQSPKSPVKDNSSPVNKRTKYTVTERPSVSPERPSYMKPTVSMSSKIDTSNITTHSTKEIHQLNIDEQNSTLTRATTSDRQSPERKPNYLSKPEETRQLRTPSPTKKTTTVIEANSDFIISEREQEILNKVQKSLRKLSPERKEKSPSRERSPTKSTTSLQDLDIITTETIETQNVTNKNLSEIVEEQVTTSKTTRPEQLKKDKLNEQKVPSKPLSRTVSPVKKTIPSSIDRTPDSPTKSRSFSPKKPVSHSERPQSPQLPKASGIKPREQIPAHLTRKPTPASLSTTKIERLTIDVKKTNGTIKQSPKTNVSKTANRSIPSPTSKTNEPDFKRTPTYKGVKDNVSPKKDVVTRTASDLAMKPKKTSSPQRMKSKPEIQVSDMSTKSPKHQKPIIKEPHSKLPSKPKSATALNTSVDEDDVIIDVQQSKSSRENSPDRICPTPINFDDDVGVPRFPDEVSEPDDDLVKRTHHTILETESVVDDIVEICEDEELFVRKSEMDIITEQDDSLLSVNDKVNKFTSKIQSVTKPKDTTTIFKDTEKRVHSDFIDENLKSDECLLTVSEKVNKFANRPRGTKDSRSPSRKITDEYDKDTVYQDDYTKLSVNDKAHLFVETAENVKVTKVKSAQKVERPDLSNVDESLKSDDCLLSVSDKVNKFVKTAEQYFTETQEDEETERKIKEQHEKVMKKIVDNEEIHNTEDTIYTQEADTTDIKSTSRYQEKSKPGTNEQYESSPKTKDYSRPDPKLTERTPVVKITTLRSSEAVKKAKALFENIASTQKTTHKDTTHVGKTTKLTDIGVIKKSPKTDSTTVLHPSVEDVSPQTTDVECETDSVSNTKEHPLSGTPTKPYYQHIDEKPRSSPNRLTAQSPEVPRSKSPMRQTIDVTATKTVLSRYPAATRAESPRQHHESSRQRPESPRQRTESPRLRTESPRQHPESDKSDKVPGYLRPTKTSQIKEETKVVEESEVSSRRGSGKFGVELRRTSVERSTVSSERRRSVEHSQPCIEDIFDLDLLEQMLEKVVGYEQRRRIRAQIRVAKSQSEHVVDTSTYTRTTKQTTTVPKTRSPERKVTKSPERAPKSASQKTSSPDNYNKSSPHKTIPGQPQPKESTMNGHEKEPVKTTSGTRQRPKSPEKPTPKSTLAPKTPVRQPSPDKRRTTSPTKTTPKTKGNRFNEYASAYMKKVGLNEADKVKFVDNKTKKTTDVKQVKHEKQRETVQEFTTTKSFTERTSSKDVIEIVQTNGKRSLSPEQRQSPDRKVQFPEQRAQVNEHRTHSPAKRTQTPERKERSPDRKVSGPTQKAQSPERKASSPERKAHSPERLHQRTPSPDFKRPKADTIKETVSKTGHIIDKKIPPKTSQEEKPSWVTNRNLKKITSETRTFSSKKIDNEKPKYRAPSPSKVISKPIDVITSSYGPGPLDADGKPLFGIKALRNGASNFQVKGTVIRQEFHSRNGSDPEGTVSVTAYSSQPEELERLLAAQGEEPPSRLHGLAAITTTKKFGGDTGNTLANVHTKEDRASLEQFTHHDRRVDNFESRSYETRSQELTADTRKDDYASSNTKRIDSKKDTRETDRSDRSTKREVKVTEVRRGQKQEERRDKMEKREDKKTVRQSSVKSLTEKYIKSANDSGKSDRSTYPKAGLILRTTSLRDSVSSDDAAPAGLVRTDSEHSLCSVDDTVVTTTTERTGDGVRTTTTRTTHHHHPTVTTHTRGSTVITHHEPVITTKKTSTVISQEPVITRRVISHDPVVKMTQGRHGSTVTTERSFLDSNTKVTGVQDILTRMKNADIVIQEGDTTEDSEARALLNKFLGATVLMAGMQGYVADHDGGLRLTQETSHRSSSAAQPTSRAGDDLDLDQCWDERFLKKLLDECTDYEQRRRLRARIRTLMAEQEACASAVTEALGAAGAADCSDGSEARGESLLLPLLQGLLGGGGERLLAGLGAAPADVVADVRRSLGRLRAALAPPAAHPQARALLALADRLEDALDAADRLDGCRRRPRRRSRANRHTVGVTREELEEARRLVDRDNLALAEPTSSAASTASAATGDEDPTPERTMNGSYHEAVAARPKQPPVAHSVSYEPPKVSHEAQVVERRAPAPRRPDYFRHSVADAPQQPPPRMERRPSETKSSIAAIANKFDANAQLERQQAAALPRRAPVMPPVQRPVQKEESQRSFFQPLPPTYNFAAPPSSQDDSKPLSRFSNSGNKKLRMKRANTIDIGKPLGGYRVDSDTDEEQSRRGPPVPEFRPQTENDRKFVAFMKKNETDSREAGTGGGQANWSNRFGNIKNAFESREREETSRSSSASSSARRFWRAAEETVPYGRRLPADASPEIIKPPWVKERREPARIHAPQMPRQIQPPRSHVAPSAPAPIAPNYAPPYAPAPARVPVPASPPAVLPPPTAVPQSPTRPVVVKPFVARPIPVNQFSHAPMSAFKPPAKLPSPTTAPAYVWSPPSLSAAASPSAENPPAFPLSPRPLTVTTPPSAPWSETDKSNGRPRQTVNSSAFDHQQKYEPAPLPLQNRQVTYDHPPPPQATHAPPPTQNYPVKTIPSQNSLAAPELVRRVDDVKYAPELPKVDAQKLQIEFYERQIREKNARRELPAARPAEADLKPPAPPAYTITDYTPKSGLSSTFVPLQLTPDIEKARAHKIDYLPDVVTNETDRLRSPLAPRAPISPRSPRSPAAAELPTAYRNGEAYTNGTHEEGTTEHEMAVTRVMRGPVRGSATITTGVRTRNDAGAADALRGALDKISSPKREVLAQIERKKREAPRSQVRAPVLNGRSPPPIPHVRPSPPSLGASRESVASSGSIASAGSGLSRSGSWHQLASGGKAVSPRKVVARAKSMHLLAIPKLYEGGIARDEVSEKKRTVEAYFAGQPAAPPTRSPPRRPARAPQYALGRSRTMAALTELQFLDESNADDAFEDLVSALA